VSHLTTYEASITGGSRGIVPYRGSSRGALAVLRKVGTLH
jgi:ribosome modulation factor